MQSLVKLIDSLNEGEVNMDFRLFISTKVSQSFPVKILQDGVKIAVENNSDLKNMMLGNLINIDEEEINKYNNP
jgi:hypothetical protein